MKKHNFKNHGIKDLSHEDLIMINGGGWLADLVEKLLCGCYGHAHSKAYSNVMARRAI